MARLVATQRFPYGGRDLGIGDEFDASDDDARILKGVGKAGDAPKRKPSPVRTRSLKAEGSDGVQDAGVQVGDGARYHRTDMRAED